MYLSDHHHAPRPGQAGPWHPISALTQPRHTAWRHPASTVNVPCAGRACTRALGTETVVDSQTPESAGALQYARTGPDQLVAAAASRRAPERVRVSAWCFVGRQPQACMPFEVQTALRQPSSCSDTCPATRSAAQPSHRRANTVGYNWCARQRSMVTAQSTAA